jgi:hypothetical protein
MAETNFTVILDHLDILGLVLWFCPLVDKLSFNCCNSSISRVISGYRRKPTVRILNVETFKYLDWKYEGYANNSYCAFRYSLRVLTTEPFAETNLRVLMRRRFAGDRASRDACGCIGEICFFAVATKDNLTKYAYVNRTPPNEEELRMRAEKAEEDRRLVMERYQLAMAVREKAEAERLAELNRKICAAKAEGMRKKEKRLALEALALEQGTGKDEDVGFDLNDMFCEVSEPQPAPVFEASEGDEINEPEVSPDDIEIDAIDFPDSEDAAVEEEDESLRPEEELGWKPYKWKEHNLLEINEIVRCETAINSNDNKNNNNDGSDRISTSDVTTLQNYCSTPSHAAAHYETSCTLTLFFDEQFQENNPQIVYSHDQYVILRFIYYLLIFFVLNSFLITRLNPYPANGIHSQVIACLGYLDNWHGITLTEWTALDVSYVSAYCLHESVTVSMAGGEMKNVREVSVGDEVAIRGENGEISSCRVVARVRYRKSPTEALKLSYGECNDDLELSPFEFVRVGSAILTKGHPIRVCNVDDDLEPKNLWRRPEDVTGAVRFTQHVREVYNFVLEERRSLLVTDERLEVATLGQFCKGVDREDSFFGSERVVRYLERQTGWPDLIVWDV